MRIHTRLTLGALALLALGVRGVAAEQNQFGSASLLPLPTVNEPPVEVARNQSAVGRPRLTNFRAETQEQVPTPANGHAEGSDYNNAMQNNGWGDDCGSCLPTACGPRWFGGIYGLYMTRDRENNLCLTVDEFASGGTGDQVLKSREASMDWAGGAEVRVGRTFCDSCYGWEAVYWGIYENGEEASVFQSDYAGNMVTSRRLDDLNLGADNVGTQHFDTAAMHRLERNYEFQNVEINLLRIPGCGYTSGCGGCGNCGTGFTAGGTFGVRYFRFDEDFLYSSDQDLTWGNDPDDEAHYLVDVENHLIGLQLGAQANYNMNCRWGFFTDLKFGAYANYMTQSQSVRDGAGNYATVNNGPFNGDEYNFESDKDDFAFLGELRLGVNYQITQRWRAVAAYRALAVTGVALSPDQVPDYFYDMAEAQQIKSSGSLILHGFQLGVECNF